MYDIDYDDGDKEVAVPAMQIRLPKGSGSGGNGGVPTSSNIRQSYQPTYQPVTLGQYGGAGRMKSGSVIGGGGAAVSNYQNKWQNYGKQPLQQPGSGRSANKSGSRFSAGARQQPQYNYGR